MHEHLLHGEQSATTVVYSHSRSSALAVSDATRLAWQELLVEGDVHLEHRVGQGGFGDVWRAIGPGGKRCIAKLPRVFPEDTRKNRDSIRMLEHEKSMLIAAAGIEGIPQLHGSTIIDGGPALILEHIDGLTWRTIFRRPCGEQRQFLKHAVSLSHTLACLHTRGIIHGDIKPDNILLGTIDRDPRPRSYLVDFGMAHYRDMQPLFPGGTVGTRGYVDPRMIGRAEERDAGSDVYSFGSMAYEGYTGFPFFSKADWNTAMLLRHHNDNGVPDTEEFSAWYDDLLCERMQVFTSLKDRVPEVESVIEDILRFPRADKPRPSATQVALRLLECLAEM